MILNEEIEKVANEITERFNPSDIILFGSYAKGLITQRSDIDICIIIDVQNKREFVQNILLSIDSESDLDVVVYTREEWEKYKENAATFANVIYRTGVSLLGRYN